MLQITSFLLLWLLPGAVLFAQAGYAVSGRMVDGVTGKPLARATVSLSLLSPDAQGRLESSQAFITGMGGTFFFRDLVPGNYQLSASRRGYLQSRYLEHEGFFAGVMVGPAKPGLRGMRFKLLPSGVIRGTVLDSSGDPVESGTVNLYQRATDGTGQMRVRNSAYLQAENSEYEFADLAPGSYQLAVSAKPWFAAAAKPGKGQSPLDLSYPVTYFENSLSEAEAQTVSVRAGETVTADFNLRAVPSVHLSVKTKAQTANDRAYYFPNLTASPFGVPLFLQAESTTTQPGPDGKQDTIFSVAPGTYQVRDGPSEINVEASSDTGLEADSTIPTITVTGKIAMADGQRLPLKLVLQLLRRQDGQTSYTAGPNGADQDQTPSAPLREDGSFTLKAAQESSYSLTLQGAGPYLVAGAAASGGEVSGDILHIGRKPVTLAATVAPSASSISGLVSNEQNAAEVGAALLLIPEDAAAGHLYREDETNTDGSWEVMGVAAGRYMAVAVRDGWDLAWKQPNVIVKYLRAGGVPVTVDGRSPLKLERPLQVQNR